MFQRKSGSTQKVGDSVKDPQDKDVKFKDKEVKYDNNNMANQAIKKAVNAGLTCRLGEYKLFEGYMACHIWDDSCHNNLFHTSVFNLVLLPKAIGGLTDYNSNVKKLLQYEAAWRFGVYPRVYNSSSFNNIPKYYKDVDNLWRQRDEHEIAKKNIENKIILSDL